MSDNKKIFELYVESAAAEEQPQMITDKWGNKRWYLHGELHRKDGPAAEYTTGTKVWRQHGRLHRDDGPAIEHANGDKSWYSRGYLHREDGPAMILANGTKAWWLHNQQYGSPEAWAEAVLKQRNKPRGDAMVDAFLKTILKKDIEHAL